MKPIAPSVPLTQPSLVPPSAEQSHTSQPMNPPQTTTATKVQNGGGIYRGLSSILESE